MPMTTTSRYDAIIVGARCAGAATALLLARAGARVLLVDRSAPGSDALSTHALMRAGVRQLHRWGLLDAVEAAGTPPIDGARFHYGDEVVDVPLKPRDGVTALYAPRRTVIDPILAEAAWAAGAEVRYHTRVTGLVRGPGGRVRGIDISGDRGAARVEADLVIGADGMRSTVAQLTGAPVLAHGVHASAVIYAHWHGPTATGYRWYFRPGAAAGVIPTNHGDLCVFVAAHCTGFRASVRPRVADGYQRLLRQAAPELVQELAGATRLGGFRSFPGEPGFLRQACGPGWALVGDAGYFRDPLTAQGMTDALRDAELLARAVTTGGDAALRAYQELRDDLSLAALRLGDRVASFTWSLPELAALHRALADEARREVIALADLDRRHVRAA